MITTTIATLWALSLVAAFVLGAVVGVRAFWSGFRDELEGRTGEELPGLLDVIRRG